ncbi:MAG TPA: protease SohB [Pseudomonadales bacterium]|nr:protease SohB [Pseudomonadales bacterium]
MLEWFAEYGMFLAKTLTFVIAIILVVAVVASIGQRRGKGHKGQIEIDSLNEEFEQLQDELQSVVLGEDEYKTRKKEQKKREKAEKKQKDETKALARSYVLSFDGDIKASAVENLRKEIDAVLSVAEEGDDIILKLESSGGMVHSYGLAASQLHRIKEQNIPLTICVDKVAASGGYMMACVADKLYAAPFALLGSIGVIAQLPNFNKLLRKNDIDFEMITAGEYKRTLTMFGENTDDARKKFKEEIDDTHDLFKQFVIAQRPQLDIDSVATGEVWFGQQALEKQLIDAISTSDSVIYQAMQSRDVFTIAYKEKHGLMEKLGLQAETSIERALTKFMSRNAQRQPF